MGKLGSATAKKDRVLEEGEQLFFDGDYEGALERFEEAISIDAEDPVVHYLHGRNLFYLGRDEEAEGSYDRALTLAPDYAPALIHKAELYVRSFGWPEDALDLLHEAESAELDRDDQIEAWFVRGLALMELTEYRRALEPLNRALRSDSDWPEALRERGICRFYLWRFEDSLRDLERAVSGDNGDAEAHYFLGMCYERLDRPADGQRSYERASALDPQSLGVPYRVSREEFQRAAHEALAELPEEFRVRFDNIELSVEELPDKTQGLLPDVYGCCAPDAKGADHDGVHPMLQPCRVTLFQRNLERISTDLGALKEEIGKTVLHEIGHHYGMNETDLMHATIH